MIRLTIGSLTAALLFGPALATGSELAGTNWRLLTIQSMEDAQGAAQVSGDRSFILQFGQDGRASLQLDCNRGTGIYTQQATGNGSSGSLRFGPIAATHALCTPPRLDERVARDLQHVRSYLFKDGRLYLSLMADSVIYEWVPTPVAATQSHDNYRIVKPVQFAHGTNSIVIRDRVVGRQYIDYQVTASAGQRIVLEMTGSNRANHFNLLPPDSTDIAMASGDLSGKRFEGLLPDDGTYTIRVFLMRSAARRQEHSDFSLSIGIAGSPLNPLPETVDAVLHGTRFHASATTVCEPEHSTVRECEAFVVRRSFDGTATVELRWLPQSKRRILFIKGEPVAADSPQLMKFTRHERGWRMKFGEDEHFEVPEQLVTGG